MLQRLLTLCALSVLGVACDPHTGRAGAARTSESAAGVEAMVRTEQVAWKAPKPGERVPVVVELFSSEGCSSCPAADEALRALDEDQSVAGAFVIPLELHVDYWNDLGWADPFSRAEFSLRQRAYADARHAHGVFTPEAIVDGKASVVGSEREALADHIRAASKQPHVEIELEAHGDTLVVRAPGAPVADVDVWLAYTEPGLSTEVTRGENAGRTLRHAPVVRSLVRLGPLAKSESSVTIPTLPTPRERLRAVVLLQSDVDGSMVGAAVTKL